MNKGFEIPKNVTIKEVRDHLSVDNKIAGLDALLSRNSIELEKSLDQIDFELLKTIFINQVGKYVTNLDRGKFISRWRIGNLSFKEGFAKYESEIQAIFFDKIKIAENMPQELFDITILNLVCHEQTHAMSHHEHVEFETNDEYSKKLKIGFDTSITRFEKHEQEESFFVEEGQAARYCEFINEAVTEKFAREIFTEYLAYKLPFLADTVAEFNRYASYQENIIYFDFLVSVIAKKADFEEEFIKQGFYSSMFGGDDFTDADFRKAINDVMGVGFSDLFFASKVDSSMNSNAPA